MLYICIGLFVVLFLLAALHWSLRDILQGKKHINWDVVVEMSEEDVRKHFPVKTPQCAAYSDAQLFKTDARRWELRQEQDPDRLPHDGNQEIQCCYELIGGTEHNPILRFVSKNGEHFPLGPDHYFSMSTTPVVGEEHRTMIIFEERGRYGSLPRLLWAWMCIGTLAHQFEKSSKSSTSEKDRTAAAPPSTNQETAPEPKAAPESFVHPSVVASTPPASPWEIGPVDQAKLAPGGRTRMEQKVARNTSMAEQEGWWEKYQQEILFSVIAFASFAIWLGWEGALLLAPIILLHEYGHLLAYQLTGKTGNRMMLLPFMGGVAVSGEAHKNEFESAFCALMGPAICIPVTLVLTALAFYLPHDGMSATETTIWWFCAYGAMICAFLNAANLAPAIPLDGGYVIRSLLRSLNPQQAQTAIMVLTFATLAVVYSHGYLLLAGMIACAGLPVLMSNDQEDKLPLLSKVEGLALFAGYGVTLAIHGGCAWLIYIAYY